MERPVGEGETQRAHGGGDGRPSANMKEAIVGHGLDAGGGCSGTDGSMTICLAMV